MNNISKIESNGNAHLFFKLINNPVKFRVFLLKNLPSAFFSGVKIRHASEERCSVSVPYKWFSTNPFRSTYFACLSMAAEMSTGVLAMAHIHGLFPKVSLLVIKVEVHFHKKATGITLLTCNEGVRIRDAVQAAYLSGESQQISIETIGKNNEGEMVADFIITWSFKRKS